MEELFGVFCAGAVLLGVITVIGHAVWVAMAALVRSLGGGNRFASSPLPPHSSGTQCGVCLRSDSVHNGRCVSCGAPGALNEQQREMVDLHATRRQLRRWEDRSQLSAELREQIASQVEQTLQQLMVGNVPVSAVVEGTKSETAPAIPEQAIDRLRQAKSEATSPPHSVAPGHTTAPAHSSPFAMPLSSPAPGAAAARPTAETSATYSAWDDAPVNAELVADPTPVHPLDRVVPSAPPRLTVTAASRRSLAEIMQAFMEQRNIRWVELLSGLLIVGCATGLVISLRAALKDKIPYFPALSFMLVTAAFHAAGMYSLRRWNLKSTSRGVLIIATLLVPLSILAAILLSGEGEQQRAATDPVLIVAMLIGVAGFGTMNYHASRALVRHAWPRAMLGVLGPSLSLLLINRLPLREAGPVTACAAMILPIGTYLGAAIWSLFRVRRYTQVGVRPARQFFLELGLCTFAVTTAMGLYIARSGPALPALRNLSPLLSLVSAAVLASGLFAHRRLVHEKLAGWQTAGTGLAFLGGGLMTLAAAFAWPNLWMLLAVGLVNFVVVSLLALAADLALLHSLAVVCLALAYLAGFHLWQGSVDAVAEAKGAALFRAVLSGTSAAALMFFSSLAAAAGGAFLRKQRDIALAYLIASGALGGIAAVAAFYVGFWGGPERGGNWATVLLAYATTGALAAGWQLRRYQSSLAGAVLGFVTCLHALWKNTWWIAHATGLAWLFWRPWQSSALLASVSMAAVAATATWWIRRHPTEEHRAEEDRQRLQGFVEPVSWTALAGSVLVCVLGLLPRERHLGIQAVYLLLASAAWLQIAWLRRSAWAWRGFQGVITGSVIVGAFYTATRQTWWVGDWGDARAWHLVMVAVAAECLGWLLLDWFVFRTRPNSFVTEAGREWTVDQLLLGALVTALVVLGFVGVIPGIGAELGTSPLNVTDPTTIAQWRFASTSAAWAWVATAIVLVTATWLRRSLLGLTGTVLLSAAAMPLIAARWTESLAAASAMRWLFAILAAAWCLPAYWFGGRGRETNGWRSDLGIGARPADVLRNTSMALALSVVVGLTSLVFLHVAGGGKIAGPDAASLFGRLGYAISYSAPLGILVAVLFAYAVREAKPDFALLGSLVFQYFISLACLLPKLSAGQPLDMAAWASCLQWNGVGLAAYAWAWWGARRWIEPDAGPLQFQRSAISWYLLQFAATLVAQLGIAVWIASGISHSPAKVSVSVAVLGGWPSYLGWLLVASLTRWQLRRDSQGINAQLAHFLLAVLGILIAATAGRLDTAGSGWAAHALIGSMTGLSVLAACWLWWQMRSLPLTTRSERTPERLTAVVWGSVGCLLTVVTGFFSWRAPMSHLPEVGSALGLSAAMAVLALRSRWLPFAYASVFAVAVATMIGHSQLPGGHPFRTELGWFPQVGTAILLAGCFWLAWEIWFQRHGEASLAVSGRGAVHRFVARGIIAITLLACAAISLHLLLNNRPETLKPAEWIAFILFFASFKALHLGLLWDRRGWFGALGLDVQVLLVSLFVVDLLPLSPDGRRAAWNVAITIPLAISGWAWSWNDRLAHWGRRFGVPQGNEIRARTSRWLLPMNLFVLACLLLANTTMVLWLDERSSRVVCACLPLVGAAGIAGWSKARIGSALRMTALLAGTWGVVLLGWSDIEPQWTSALFLTRVIRMLMALVVVGFAYGVVGVRIVGKLNLWNDVIRRATVLLIAGALAVLLVVLATEAVLFEPGVGVPVSPIQVIAVSCMLVGLVVTLISLAVLPGRDPLALSERGRMAYVYGAQGVAALLFAHIYLAMPHLFQGTLRHYWPYIVLTIAFAGVGVGTIFERLGWRVLAEPFQRSGSFLPIVPALGMWVVHSGSSYTSVLFVIGMLYMLLSFSQRSPLAAAAAAVAGNGSLWSLLSGQEDLSFGSHPQFWLIPPAISVLLAAQVNRARLGDARVAAIRYGMMGVIYLSSTVEMLKIGIGQTLWPPLILILLALMGVAFGIAMRVRAYLYLGAAFVVVGVLTMVAHAAKSTQQLWPWFAFGIAIGTALLVLFGYFERHRARIMPWLERLREWDT